MREMNEKNTKKFIDERRRQADKQSQQTDNLKKSHQEQLDKLLQELTSVIYQDCFLTIIAYLQLIIFIIHISFLRV